MEWSLSLAFPGCIQKDYGNRSPKIPYESCNPRRIKTEPFTVMLDKEIEHKILRVSKGSKDKCTSYTLQPFHLKKYFFKR